MEYTKSHKFSGFYYESCKRCNSMHYTDALQCFLKLTIHINSAPLTEFPKMNK